MSTAKKKLRKWPRSPRRPERRPLRLEALERRDLLAADPVISEIVADNEGGLTDADGDWSDWIEITNYGDATIDLNDWFLTDDPGNLDKWRFPSTVIDANQSIVVFASNKDRNDTGAELHTDFTLNRHGESLLLVRPDGSSASDLSFPFMPENRSYGTNSAGKTGYFATATPGVINPALTLETGALIVNVLHSPALPSANQDITITAEIDLSEGVPASATMTYVVGFGDPVSISMFDDGIGADASAADGIYTSVIPSGSFAAGEMVRWFVTTLNDSGVSTRSLLWDTSVIDRMNAPEYHGTVIQDTAINSELPVLHWFVQDTSAAERESGTRAAAYYDGEFYDNIFVRRRGGSTGGLPKKSFKFDFNQGHHFRFNPNESRVSEINLNTTYSDKSYVRANLAFEVYDLLGAPGSISFPMRMQQNGEFFSVSTFVEQPDEDLLAREGLDPNGALYKSFSYFSTSSGNFEKKTRQDEGNSDLNTFINQIRNNSGDALTHAIFDVVDVPAVINYLVGNVLAQNNDQQRKNHYLYRDSEGTGEWLILPWDLDLTYGRHWMTPNSIGGGGNNGDGIWADEDHFVYSGSGFTSPSHPFAGEAEHPGNRSWNRLIDKLFENDEIREMFLRRLRTGMDELLQAPETPYEQRWIESRLDELAAQIGSDASLDYGKWRSGSVLTMQQAMLDIKREYLSVRRTHLYETHLDGSNYADAAEIPSAQIPTPKILFGDIEESPSSGSQDEEYIQLINPGDAAIDISGWRLTGGVEHTFRPGTVIRANSDMYVVPDAAAFRGRQSSPTGGQGRFVQGGYDGHLSNGGESIQLVSATGATVALFDVPDTRSDVQRYLRVSELNYNPTVSGDATEFIEIANISDSMALNLSGVSITDGPSSDFFFDFGTTLGPGEYRLIVKEQVAFTAAYPSVPSWKVLGEFSGGLSNGGEKIKIEDADQNTVVEIQYGDADPWPTAADGVGATLELNTAEIDIDSRTDKPHYWSSSQQIGGSPGSANAAFFDVAITEVLSSSGLRPDSVELHNPKTIPVNIGGWYLSDSANNLLKYKIPTGTTIPAGGYIVFDESHFNPNPSNPGPNHFGLNGTFGDDVWLTIADGNGNAQFLVDDVHFGPTFEGVTLGRIPEQSGRLMPTSHNTLGCYNPSAAVSNVVISEVHYHPADPSPAALALAPSMTESELEFIEIVNQGLVTIDLAGWRLDGDIELVFAASSELAAGETAVVVGFDPIDATNADLLAAFQAEFGDTPQIVGGFSGSLSNSTGIVQLLAAEIGLGPVLVDEVYYDDQTPWPDADGSGDSITRRSGLVAGNITSAWRAHIPTPGAFDAAMNVQGDLDRDGAVTGDDVDIFYDLLFQDKAATNESASFKLDLNGDGFMNNDDAIYLIEELADKALGDANLDGVVNDDDFAIWNENRFQSCGQSYRSGDFNFDGITDISDFNLWLTNKESSAATSVYIPRAAPPAIVVVAEEDTEPPSTTDSPAPPSERKDMVIHFAFNTDSDDDETEPRKRVSTPQDWLSFKNSKS